MKYLKAISCFNALFLTAAVICSCAFTVRAQAPVSPAVPATQKPVVAPAPKSALAIIDDFFKKYKDEGTGPAVDYLFGTNKNFTNTAGIAEMKVRLDSLRQSTGAYLSKELIAQRSSSPSLYLYSVLVKFEIQPIRFTFIFYKPKAEWTLYRFKYDDQMDLELEEAAKINNKHP
jgi:hypothetical protein